MFCREIFCGYELIILICWETRHILLILIRTQNRAAHAAALLWNHNVSDRPKQEPASVRGGCDCRETDTVQTIPSLCGRLPHIVLARRWRLGLLFPLNNLADSFVHFVCRTVKGQSHGSAEPVFFFICFLDRPSLSIPSSPMLYTVKPSSSFIYLSGWLSNGSRGISAMNSGTNASSDSGSALCCFRYLSRAIPVSAHFISPR